MKVIIENPLGIISSAYYCKYTDITSILMIITKERWRNFDASGSFNNTDYFFEYWSDNIEDEDYKVDRVTLIAENGEEKEVLTRLRFHQQEKEQMQILFIVDNLIGG